MQECGGLIILRVISAARSKFNESFRGRFYGKRDHGGTEGD